MNELKKRSSELCDLQNILALMQWDQEVRMPARASEARAQQFATLSGIVHRRETDPELGRLLDRAESDRDRLSVEERALVRVMRRGYDQSTRLPEEFVVEFARLTSESQMKWVDARKKSDFTLFEPSLARIVAMSRQKAAYLGYQEHPYDALLDLHEEGLTASKTSEVFSVLRQPLQELVAKLARRDSNEIPFAEPFPHEGQVRFAEYLLEEIGFDFQRGCMAQSAHPFSTTLGHHDRRVTNRYKASSAEFIFTILHEGGHALYEQGIDERYSQTHLDSGVSLGIHESQSRLWENIIGRSRPFWERYYPVLQCEFPAQFGTMALDGFIGEINAVRPGLIRVEADEVCYNLHVLIRFELEKALLEDALAVKDLPAVWNEMYRDYLDVAVDSDANGVLQDVHWSHGSIGYFPTYTIGNLAAAQFWDAYRQHDPEWETTLAHGDHGKVRHWLTDSIYRHGSVHTPEELLVRITGKKLDSSFFLSYLQGKYFGVA